MRRRAASQRLFSTRPRGKLLLAFLLALAAELLELGEHCADVEIAFRLGLLLRGGGGLRLLLRGGLGRRQQGRAGVYGRRLLLVGAVDLEVESDLLQSQRNRKTAAAP